MNIKLTCSLVALLSASVLAQGHLTTPPLGTDKEGDGTTTVFGWNADYRHLIVDASHAHNKAYTLTRVSFRANYQDQKSAGRTWTNVALYVHNVDWNPVKLRDTGTTVFDTKWSWPTLDGYPVLKPDNWGGAKNQLSFTFSKPWAYTGKHAMLLDFRFRGGKLASGKSWVGFNQDTIYNLDTVDTSAPFHTAEQTTYPAKPAMCYNSGDGWPAGTNISVATHHKTTPPTVQITFDSLFTGRKSPVIHAIGVAGWENGVDIGAKCNKLYVDVTQPTLLYTLPAPNNGLGRASKSTAWPWMPEFKNLWMQAAWADDKTQQLSLTWATKAEVVDPRQVPQAKATYNIRADQPFPIGNRFWITFPAYLPMLRYDHK